MKIKLNSDDKLPRNKTIEVPNITIVVRAIFIQNNKYYPQVFLNECLYKISKMKSKNCTNYYFDDCIYFSDNLLDKKLYENISGYDISYKTSMNQNHCVLGSIK